MRVNKLEPVGLGAYQVRMYHGPMQPLPSRTVRHALYTLILPLHPHPGASRPEGLKNERFEKQIEARRLSERVLACRVGN